MSNRVAAIVVNYNMPERADALAEAINRSAWPVDCILVDNGSDLVPPAKHTTFTIKKNCQTTRGWLTGVEYAKKLGDYFAYMFIITSAQFASGDPVAECAFLLTSDPNAAGAHAALTVGSTTAWKHMKNRHSGGNRQTWMIDNIASMYRADFFDAHPFDPRLIYGHGIDLEICYMARKENRSLWICEGAEVEKITDIGYTMQRMNMTADERNRKAMANMKEILVPQYGPDFWGFLTREHVTDELP
jgi:hypothetical protein